MFRNPFSKSKGTEMPAEFVLRLDKGCDFRDLVNELTAKVHPLFLSTSVRDRRKAMALVTAEVVRGGGVPVSQESASPVQAVLDSLAPMLMLSEHVFNYTALAERQSDNARIWKLLGLHAYWLAYRCRGGRYADVACSAFARALTLPNKELPHTPLRIASWLFCARFLGDFGNLEAQIESANQINGLAFDDNGQRIPQLPVYSNIGELFNAIVSECEGVPGGRYADEGAIGITLRDKILADLFRAKVGQTFQYRGQLVESAGFDLFPKDSDEEYRVWLSTGTPNPMIVRFVENANGKYSLCV